MTIKELLENPKTRGLSATSFKAYCVLLNIAGEEKIIKNFSIRGQAREWDLDKNLNLISSKNTMKKILDELQELKLIKIDLEKKTVKFLK